jgi:hypothetical protein
MAELDQRMDGAFWAAQDAGALGCVKHVGRPRHRPGKKAEHFGLAYSVRAAEANARELAGVDQP